MSEWISVKEKLPVTGSLCLVVWAGTVQKIAYRRVGLGFDCVDGYAWEDACDEYESIPDEEITHWMPLPAPPEEQP